MTLLHILGTMYWGFSVFLVSIAIFTELSRNHEGRRKWWRLWVVLYLVGAPVVVGRWALAFVEENYTY